MRVVILTGGGDCPGLNAVIRAVVRKAVRTYRDDVLGSLDGWRGLMDGETVSLDIEVMRGTLPRGGTVLGTSRLQPYTVEGGLDRVRTTMNMLEIDAVIAVGGEGTLSCARELHRDGLPVVGVPKTIDNDIDGTELTFGFDTAVQIATEAIDRLHTTAESHDRVIVVEVMGRHVGHIATWAGLAGGATMVLIPEEPFDIEEVCDVLKRRHRGARYASIVVVAEGALPIEGTMAHSPAEIDVYGHARLGGIAVQVAAEIEERTGIETRVTALGHVQRGGTPTAFDRVLSTRFGIAAIDAVHDGAFGQMVAMQCGRIVRVPLAEATGQLKTVAPELREVARQFFAS
jgi:ATP-dependent phosphofructokinase / diphosphate-dependent phosphofructokinase